MNFQLALAQKIIKNLGNNHSDNWDDFRFGPEKRKKKERFIPSKIDILNSKGYVHFLQTKEIFNYAHSILEHYWSDLERTYFLLLEDKSKEVYVEVIAYIILGHRKVKIYTNNLERKNLINKINKFKVKDRVYKSNFENKDLSLFNFKYDNENISFYTRSPLNTFFLKQYRLGNKISPVQGDVIIDCGACWGDTPLEFAASAGDNGFVYAFEFIPKNLQIIEMNLSLNKSLKKRIKIIEKAVWSESDLDVYYVDDGPGSRVELEKFENYEGHSSTLKIDDLVENEKIEKVDFIKMDIEGAEPEALKGAINTITRFKPKLAISIYHSMSDFSNIAVWLNSLNLEYKYFVRHFTIHQEETVLFATCD